tara:strand:- start:258 stop:491 length:234 start_codon:yes stop_codon:yes gene_type:complete
MKKRRFWFHYHKQESTRQSRNVLTIHWKNKCNMVNGIICEAPTETHNRKAQPRCILRGWANTIEFIEKDGETLGVIK